MKTTEITRKLSSTLLTLGKVLLKSKKTMRSPTSEKFALPNPGSRRIIIMGNGPSLRQTIDENADNLKANDTMAVNFAANTPEFFSLKPRHYILADPHFFKGETSDSNVGRLWENLEKTDWKLTLHLPSTMYPASGRLRERLPSNVSIAFFNMTPGEGFDAVTHYLFRHGLAMPRPRNVMIPAIMQAIAAGYREIFIVGADHTWPHTLYVDDSNRVVSVQPHFYKDDPSELDRVAQEYSGIHIYDVLGSMVVAFRSYHEIERFAAKEGVDIFNSTPGSLIDAFRRRPLKDLE